MDKILLKTVKKNLRKAANSYFNYRLNSKALQMLFIMGHMRSGSSLLVHILNTNPKIIGYGETHHIYQDESDFSKAALKIYRSFNTFPIKETYILDKILHTRFLKKAKLLETSKTIFLIREPSQAFPSLQKIDPQKYTSSFTFEHYVDRINYILNSARTLAPKKWIFITYEQLVNCPEDTFHRLETFLGLKDQLSANYNTIWSTGKIGIGDPSKNIHEGKIVKKKEQQVISKDLEPFILKAQKKFLKCHEELTQLNIY